MSLVTFRECVWESDVVCAHFCVWLTLLPLFPHGPLTHWLPAHTSILCGPVMQFRILCLFCILLLLTLLKRDFFFFLICPVLFLTLCCFVFPWIKGAILKVRSMFTPVLSSAVPSISLTAFVRSLFNIPPSLSEWIEFFFQDVLE